MIVNVPLDTLETLPKLQLRAAGLDQAVVDDYAEAYRQGRSLPPLGVAKYDGRHILWDGYHRHAAAVLAEKPELPIEVTPVCKWTDVLLLAAGANAHHGLRRTQADKRRAVDTLLADPDLVALSDRELARHAKVSHTYVANVRRELYPPAPAPAPAMVDSRVQYDCDADHYAFAGAFADGTYRSFRLPKRDAGSRVRIQSTALPVRATLDEAELDLYQYAKAQRWELHDPDQAMFGYHKFLADRDKGKYPDRPAEPAPADEYCMCGHAKSEHKGGDGECRHVLLSGHACCCCSFKPGGSKWAEMPDRPPARRTSPPAAPSGNVATAPADPAGVAESATTAAPVRAYVLPPRVQLASGEWPNEHGVFSYALPGVEVLSFAHGKMSVYLRLAQLKSGGWIGCYDVTLHASCTGAGGSCGPMTARERDIAPTRAAALRRAAEWPLRELARMLDTPTCRAHHKAIRQVVADIASAQATADEMDAAELPAPGPVPDAAPASDTTATLSQLADTLEMWANQIRDHCADSATGLPSPCLIDEWLDDYGDAWNARHARRCRVCGCTDDDCSACVERTGEPCYWVEDDLCSACVAPADAPAPADSAPPSAEPPRQSPPKAFERNVQKLRNAQPDTPLVALSADGKTIRTWYYDSVDGRVFAEAEPPCKTKAAAERAFRQLLADGAIHIRNLGYRGLPAGFMLFRARQPYAPAVDHSIWVRGDGDGKSWHLYADPRTGKPCKYLHQSDFAQAWFDLVICNDNALED